MAVDTRSMRANRLASVFSIGFLAVGLAGTTIAISDDAPSTSPAHPHDAAACVTCHLGRGGDSATEARDVCAACHHEASPSPALLGAWGPSGAPGAADLHGGSAAGSVAGSATGSNAGSASGSVAGATATSADASLLPDATGTGRSTSALSSDCLRCHSFHAPTTIALVAQVADLANPRVGDHCGACHDHADPERLGRLTEGHVAAAALYHWMGPELASLTTSEACLICHDRDGNLPTSLPVFLPVTPRFETHASHPFGIRMSGGDFFRPVIDPRIPLFDGNIECLTCHDLGAQNEDLVIAFETKYEMCRGCHTQGLARTQPVEALVEN